VGRSDGLDLFGMDIGGKSMICNSRKLLQLTSWLNCEIHNYKVLAIAVMHLRAFTLVWYRRVHLD